MLTSDVEGLTEGTHPISGKKRQDDGLGSRDCVTGTQVARNGLLRKIVG